MNFNDEKPIYRQIIDYCFGFILSGEWQPDQRIPSVREMAVNLAVNTHTVIKAYDFLQAHDIIAPRRGMGYYLTPDARQMVNASQREDFFDTSLSQLFSRMKVLGIGIDEINDHWKKFNGD